MMDGYALIQIANTALIGQVMRIPAGNGKGETK